MSDDQNLDPLADMEATMAAAFDKATAVEDETTEIEADQETSLADDAGGDDDGNGDDAAEASAEAGDDAEEDADQASDDDDGADADASLSPPSRWSDADKAEFNSLTPDAQKLVLKRERDVEAHLTRKSQELTEAQKTIGAVADIVEQRKGAWAASGMSPDQAVSQLLQLSDYAGSDPQGFMQWFAQQHGLTAPTQSAEVDDDYGDPEIKSLKAEVEQLRAMANQQTQQTVAQRLQTVQQAIQDFSQDAQKAPYFAELESEIAGILPAVKQSKPGGSPREWLEEAYNKAVWLNEGTRARELERQEAQKREQSRKAASRAKKAARGNIRGSAGNGVSETVVESMEETMARAYDKAVGAI